MPINWQDGAAGGTPLSAANLNRLAVVTDIGTAGTPTGDAVRTAAAAQVTDAKMASALGAATAAAIVGRAELKAAFAASLIPTATKTAAYTAAVGDLAMMNVAGGATALTLPTAPADRSLVGYRAIGATAAVPLIVTAGGTDTIGTTGTATVSIPLADEVAVLQYQAAGARWLGVANVKTQASLDTRYGDMGVSALVANAGSATSTALKAAYAPLTTIRERPAMPPPAKIISRFPSGHGWTGGTDDLTVKLYGDRSLKVTTNGTGGSAYLSSPAFAAIDCTSSYVRVVVRVDDPTRLNAFQLYLDSVAGGASSYVTGFASQFIRTGDWSILTVPRAQFTVAAGTPAWNNIVGARIRVQDKSGSAPVTVNVAAVEVLPDRASVYPFGVLVVECDDGYAAQKTVLRPMLDSLGVPCTINPIIERINNGAAGITAADLRDMQDRSGWQISAHAYAQAMHDGPADATSLGADWSAAKAWLHNNGLHAGADDYALCPATGTGLVPAGAIRDQLGNYWRSARMFAGFYETVVPGEPLSFRSLGFSGNSNANMQSNIDQAASSGGVFHISVHDVLTGATNGTSNSLPAIAVNNLQTIVSYALGKGMVARTRGDWLAGR